MLFGQHTPESLLTRSDSKNPATTCKGITSTGRSCRRALAASRNLPQSTDHEENGVLAVLDAGDAAVFFCWQHKDQAESLVASLKTRSTIVNLKKKTSIDTLVERFGVLDVEEGQIQKQSRNHLRAQSSIPSGPPRKNRLPQQWQDIQGPLMVVPEEVMEDEGYPTRPANRSRPRPQRHSTAEVRRSNVKASWSCCIRADAEEDPPPARRRETNKTRRQSDHTQIQPARSGVGSELKQIPQQSTPVKRKPVALTQSPQMQQKQYSIDTVDSGYSSLSPIATPTRPQLQPRHASSSPPNSQTMTFLSYIPHHLSPSITSTLLTELSRPISEADEEGYIYIFWLTPESDDSKPDDETASSLLDADDSPASSPSASRRHNSAISHNAGSNSRTTQALQRFASVKHSPQEPRKILLKIGRTANVHRRLTQWTKQCGQNITLVRYYPHTSSQISSSRLYPRADHARNTVPHVHRVERLIHLELAEKRVTDKDECDSCGRVHREWFEVEATKRGVREVDEVIRRWIDWAENHSIQT